jgi:hypothetical protein
MNLDWDESAIAVASATVFVANNAARTIEAMQLPDLTSLATVSIQEEVKDLFVVADQLLTSGDGMVRLDLPIFLIVRRASTTR